MRFRSVSHSRLTGLNSGKGKGKRKLLHQISNREFHLKAEISEAKNMKELYSSSLGNFRRIS